MARWLQASTSLFSGWISASGSVALAQRETFTVHIHDMHVVGQTVQNGTGQAF